MNKKKQRPRFFNNMSLKIFSLLSAVVLWLLVTNFSDPTSTFRGTNISVHFLHTNVVTDQGEVYTVLNDTDTIPVVTIVAKRSIVDALENDNIIATADFNDMDSSGNVPITVTTNKYSDEIERITYSVDTLQLDIEEKETKTLSLTAGTTGDVEDGYIIGSETMDQNQIRVTGPKSFVDNCASASVTVDVSGATSSISTSESVHLYDAQGEELEISDNVSLSVDRIMVTVEILPTKSVTVSYSTTGTPADGYKLSGDNTVTPNTIVVAARKSVLDDLSTVKISSDALDVSGLSSDLRTTVDISDYLPDGVTLADSSFDGKISVTIGIEKDDSSS